MSSADLNRRVSLDTNRSCQRTSVAPGKRPLFHSFTVRTSRSFTPGDFRWLRTHAASTAWSAAGRTGARVRVGTLAEFVTLNPGLPVLDGFPVYVPSARAFVMLTDPTRGTWQPGVDDLGDGTALNVRALSQVCPHLGCRPNPCLEDFWFHCPCHQSRYDRLGTKPAGERFGPAPRGMDRFAIEVDAEGVLTIDTARITLGPLPVALGQPGVLLPRVQDGCV